MYRYTYELILILRACFLFFSFANLLPSLWLDTSADLFIMSMSACCEILMEKKSYKCLSLDDLPLEARMGHFANPI
ncbi:hypothetical protein HDV62DRAFT_373149 [Trichoderma sp. SZMC 28011]